MLTIFAVYLLSKLPPDEKGEKVITAFFVLFGVVAVVVQDITLIQYFSK